MGDNNNKEPTVGVDVSNDDITPITHQPILPVDSSEWHNLTIKQLYEQMEILNERMYSVGAMGKVEVVRQIQRGIMQLQATIDAKTEPTEKIIT